MDIFLAICQGLGLALAIGIGGMLAALLAAVLAHVGIGWELERTDFSWFASEWFVALLFGLNVLVFAFARSNVPRRTAFVLLLVLLSALGAVVFAASLAEEAAVWWPGFAAGALATAGAAALTESVLAGAAARAREAEATLTLIAAGTGLVLVVGSLFVPPLSLAVLIGLVVLATGRRRRSASKYEGLRSLR